MFVRHKSLAILMLIIVLAFASSTSLFAQNQNVDLSRGLVAYWKCDEGEGDVVFDETGHHDGILKCTGGSCELPRWVQGRIGLGILIHEGGFIRIPNDPELNFATSFTIAVWLKPIDLTTSRYFVWKLKGNTGYVFHLRSNPVGKVTVEVGEGTKKVGFTSHGALPLNEWSHLAITFDGEYMRLYINGAHDSSRAFPNLKIATNDRPLDFGFATGQGYRGILDEVRIYDRALSKAEIATVFAYTGKH